MYLKSRHIPVSLRHQLVQLLTTVGGSVVWILGHTLDILLGECSSNLVWNQINHVLFWLNFITVPFYAMHVLKSLCGTDALRDTRMLKVPITSGWDVEGHAKMSVFNTLGWEWVVLRIIKDHALLFCVSLSLHLSLCFCLWHAPPFSV